MQSPCVKNCCLNNLDVCMGCGRTLTEITGWRGMSEEQRQAVMDRLLESVDDSQSSSSESATA